MKGFLITIAIVFGGLGIGMAGKYIELIITKRWRKRNMKTAYTWDELKASGSAHYKTGGGVEPVDLYLAGDMFQDFALCSIIKYAFRSRRSQEIAPDLFIKNMNKIIDYSQKLIAAEGKK